MKFYHLILLFIYGLVLIFPNIISNLLVDANPLTAPFNDIHTLIRRKSNEKPPSAPSSGANPVQINNWWNGLPSDNQKQIINQFPEYIGSTDGIPTVARDTANRAITEKDLRANYNEFKNNRNLKSYVAVLKKQLIGIHDLQTRLGGKWDVKQNNQIEPRVVTGNIDPKDPTQHLPGEPASDQPYLLGFNMEGTGHFILSIGLPETADNIVTTVPGVGRGVNDVLYQDLSNNDATASKISEILKNSGNINNALIIWDDYDAPVDLPAAFGSSRDNAREAAPALELFQQGLVAIHKGTPPHITVVGHSFGTDVVTETTINGHKLVSDDAILIGSPGVPVDHASQIANNMIPSNTGQNRTPRTRVWASRTGSDPITCLFNDFLRSFALGTDTVSNAFGASIFTSDPQGDHGGYWQGIGLKNMAYIELGNYNSVELTN
ncbi:23017_t:CDS:1 [Dentiscutata erythropus]|uniref:23017_t:CDS:1 n=1 Tax=Dentiscutata erythropus TaxID=1348616 RepID=A0A9N9HUM3_9GLOM|nr:23017_t:CDS:1 [Dentiscutata erythropus]